MASPTLRAPLSLLSPGTLHPSRILSLDPLREPSIQAFPNPGPCPPFSELDPMLILSPTPEVRPGKSHRPTLTLSNWFSTILILFRVLAFWSSMTPGALGSLPQAESRASHSWICREEGGAVFGRGQDQGRDARKAEWLVWLASGIQVAPALPSTLLRSAPYLPQGSGFQPQPATLPAQDPALRSHHDWPQDM